MTERARWARGGRLAAAAVALGLIAAACGGSDGSSEDPGSTGTTAAGGQTADACTEDRVGGSLTMGVYSENISMDPTVSAGYGVSGGIELAAVYDRLMRYEPTSGEWVPQMAESLEPNADFTVWTLTLRDGVTFGNGDLVTTEAVVHSIERARADTVRSGIRALARQAGTMAVVDDLTMTFTLPTPWPGFPTVLADEAGMVVNPAVVDSMDPAAFALDPAGAGAGAFEVERFVPGDEIVMTAKDDYWGGPVCIEQLRFVFVPGGAATYEAFGLDELDVALIRDPLVAADVADDGVANFSTLVNMGEAILINAGQGGNPVPTSDVRLRQAVAHAIDPEQLAARAWEGNGLPTSAVLSEPSLYFDGGEGPAYDPAKARALVDEVKAEGAWDGSLRLVCPQRPEFDLALEAMLEAGGFDVALNNTLTIADAITSVRVNGDYDVACWGLDADDPDLWRRLNDNLNSANSRTGYASPEMDAALAALRGAMGIDETKAAMDQVQEVWNATVPAAPVAGVEQVVIYDDDVRGLLPTSKSVVLFSEAYLEG
jgi:peptide/nickel transport system substrate-binding protein